VFCVRQNYIFIYECKKQWAPKEYSDIISIMSLESGQQSWDDIMGVHSHSEVMCA
jgi:hypothetical protein